MKQICIILLVLLFPAVVFSASPCAPSDYTCAEAEVLLDTVNTMDQTLLQGDDVTFQSVTITGAAGNGGFEIDPFPDTDQTCEGIIWTVTVDSTDGVGYVLSNYTDFNFDTASATDDTKPPIAIACEDGAGTKEVMILGTIRDDAWNWSVGWIYLATDGSLTQTRPVASGNVGYIVGRAMSADVVYFNPNFGGTEQ